jgi:hypothetical protein
MLDNPKIGFASVQAFAVSALPWVTSSYIAAQSIVEVNFPNVTKFVLLKNDGPNPIHLGFTRNGLKPSSGNFLTLSANESFSFDIRVRDVFLSGSLTNYELIAGLTMISRSEMPVLTGSLWSGVG